MTCSGLGVHTPLDWLIDAGASHHVCAYRNAISTYCHVSGTTVKCANGQNVPVHLVTDVDGRQTSVWLHEVLFAPGTVSCIISASKLVQTGVTLSSGRKNCTLPREQDILDVAVAVGNFYKVHGMVFCSEQFNVSMSKDQQTAQLWHLRLVTWGTII
jgi:hypothetical protein